MGGFRAATGGPSGFPDRLSVNAGFVTTPTHGPTDAPGGHDGRNVRFRPLRSAPAELHAPTAQPPTPSCSLAW
ncbi:hypothetical protein Pen01_05840 [Phytomonospora endophytica]|nr:hypothetical protein Pen01_05840 [Phytomonospora endophytica]